MNPVNFVAQFIRGWLPEEPKMPKTKLKQLRAPIAVLAVASTVVSLFSYSVFFSTQTAVLVPPLLVVQGAPNSSYVELAGVADQNSSFILVLADGNYVGSENLTLTFSLTEKGGDACTVRLAVECDGFSNEVTVDGSIVDGNLVIDSRRSLFLINPNVTQKHVVLTETDDWQLTAMVRRTGKFSTSVDPYKVTGVWISSDTIRTVKGWPLMLHVGYDPDTGILVYSGYSLSDVLLEKLGIDLLLGGSLELVSYSDNLNLEIVNVPPPQYFNLGFVLFIVLVSSLVVVPIGVVHVVRKRRKRTQAGASNIPELHDDSKQNCDRNGW
jgi:hypothetical protein